MLKKAALLLAMIISFSTVAYGADPFSPHWEIDSNQVWHYRMNDGSYARDAWIHDEVNGDWYLLDKNGDMLSGVFVSYGKYYFLDTVRGTGHYGRLLKNGHRFKDVTIEASTNAADEGALSEETLKAIGGVDGAVEISGTKHIEAGEVTN